MERNYDEETIYPENIYDCKVYDGYGSYSIPYKLNHKKVNAKPGEHVMNKNEAKTMRRIKSQTGLSESEIRNRTKYNKMLSEAQDKGERPKSMPS